METDTLAMAQEIDFSLLALFVRATLTVKIVMIMLLIMSFWSWAIIIQKHIDVPQGARPRRRSSTAPSGRASRWTSCSKRSGRTRRAPSEKIFAAGMLEWRRSHRQDGGLIAGRAGADRPGDGRGDRARKRER